MGQGKSRVDYSGLCPSPSGPLYAFKLLRNLVEPPLYSVVLTHSRFITSELKIGSREWIRTTDPYHVKVVL